MRPSLTTGVGLDAVFVDFVKEGVLVPLVLGFVEAAHFVVAFVHVRKSELVHFIHVVVRGIHSHFG